MDLQKKNDILDRFARGSEDELIERYITDGPAELRARFGLSDEQWQVIFDYLVFEHNLLYKAVIGSSDFFLDNYIKYGMTHVREVLDVAEPKYDAIFEVVFDFLAVVNEGLYYHVLQHRDRYMIALQARSGDFVRKVLGLWKDKYDGQWEKVLDIFLSATCDAMFTESTIERGLKSFCCMMNVLRVHRPVVKPQIIRQDQV